MIWKWRQLRVGLIVAMVVLACGIMLMRPGYAHAGWPLKTAGTIALGFGQTYSAAGADASSTHRGVDVSAESGCAILAPLSGSVTFAGCVPAVGGGTVRAVTIATAAGSVTLLPIEGATVTKGDSVAEGDAIGVLAESGDGSSATPHLHIGVKRGDLYVDPLSVLEMPAVQGESAQQDGRTASSEEVNAEHAAARARADVERATMGEAGGRVGERMPSEATGSDGAASVSRSAMPGAVLEPGVSVAGAPAAEGRSAGEGVGMHEGISAGAKRLAGLQTGSGKAESSMAGTISEVAGWLGHLIRSVGRVLAIGLFIALAAVGALWPLWRTEQRKDSGEISVSALGDDVAAVVGR
jgi:Peptidase family M23